jgi:hypothetical protein
VNILDNALWFVRSCLCPFSFFPFFFAELPPYSFFSLRLLPSLLHSVIHSSFVSCSDAVWKSSGRFVSKVVISAVNIGDAASELLLFAWVFVGGFFRYRL